MPPVAGLLFYLLQVASRPDDLMLHFCLLFDCCFHLFFKPGSLSARSSLDVDYLVALVILGQDAVHTNRGTAVFAESFHFLVQMGLTVIFYFIFNFSVCLCSTWSTATHFITIRLPSNERLLCAAHGRVDATMRRRGINLVLLCLGLLLSLDCASLIFNRSPCLCFQGVGFEIIKRYITNFIFLLLVSTLCLQQFGKPSHITIFAWASFK